MLRIWGRANSVNVQKVMWCVAELGVPHERVDAGLGHGRNDEGWFLAKNPNGTVPLLEDGDYSLWESNTIVRYLCAKHDFGGLYPEPLRVRADAERWMDWQLSMLAQPVRTAFVNLVRTPEGGRDSDAVERAVERANHVLESLDRCLADRDFVAGGRLTMGDIPLGALVHRWLVLPAIPRRPLPNVVRWHGRLAERGPYREHVMLPLS
jgi:glutathione S-transferase